MSNLNTMLSIARDSDATIKFNDNFIFSKIINKDNLLKTVKAGPLKIADLENVCTKIDMSVDDICFACYDTEVIHLIFKSDYGYTMYTIRDVIGELDYLHEVVDNIIWGRLQRFFYVDISPYVSFAKKAPKVQNGKSSLDTLLDRYRSCRVL